MYNIVTTLAGAGPITVVTDAYGLDAYLLNHVENTGGGGIALTAAQVVTIKAALIARVVAGATLTLAQVNIAINAAAGVAGSDLNGVLGNSTGVLEDLLRILTGEVYKLPATSQIETAGNAFDVTDRGFFVTTPNIERAMITGPGGLNPVYHNMISHTVPTQTGTQDVLFRDIRRIEDTGALRLSCAGGVLSQLRDAAYLWLNPANAYTAATVTAARPRATDVGGGNIPATGIFPGVVVYSNTGTVITV